MVAISAILIAKKRCRVLEDINISPFIPVAFSPIADLKSYSVGTLGFLRGG